MVELQKIAIAPDLTFDAWVSGKADAPLVLLLHGFAESFHMWRSQLPALAAAGYRAVAPSQRGYSPGARPATSEHANYSFDRLLGDALEVVGACGNGKRRFHLVGHDWGASIAWGPPTARPNASPRSRSCRARIRTRSTARSATRCCVHAC